MKKLIGVTMLAFLLSACDKPKIDASTDESMKESIQKIRETLPQEKQPQFDDALKVVAFSQVSMRDLMQAGVTKDADFVQNRMKTALAGKTGDEVISYAETIKLERQEREKEQALQEITELENRKKTSAESVEQLKAFKVTSSRFYFQKEKYGSDQPIIALSVENATPKAVSRAHFKGVIASPDRSVPWFSDSFNYEIAGGLEPGEKADWALAPNRFSDWGKLKLPADAVFTVTVVGVDDANGKPIFGNAEFTKRDAVRLDGLKKKYSVN